jgi:hypothetical protein
MVVLTYYRVSWHVRLLTRHAVVCGILYGLAVWVVMNFVVLPLSAVPPRVSLPPAVLINGLLIHAFGVGLPAALFSRWAR